jgi:hypothetical protein
MLLLTNNAVIRAYDEFGAVIENTQARGRFQRMAIRADIRGESA